MYFHCTGPTKLYNVNYWVPNQSITGWNTTPPGRLGAEGAGCGGVEYGGYTNAAYDVAFGARSPGTFAI